MLVVFLCNFLTPYLKSWCLYHVVPDNYGKKKLQCQNRVQLVKKGSLFQTIYWSWYFKVFIRGGKILPLLICLYFIPEPTDHCQVFQEFTAAMCHLSMTSFFFGLLMLEQKTCNGSSVTNFDAEFSISLYQALAETDNSSNLIVSPASISLSLRLLQLGARGNTLAQIERTMGYDINGEPGIYSASCFCLVKGNVSFNHCLLRYHEKTVSLFDTSVLVLV